MKTKERIRRGGETGEQGGEKRKKEESNRRLRERRLDSGKSKKPVTSRSTTVLSEDDFGFGLI